MVRYMFLYGLSFRKSIFPGSNALIPCIGAVLILISSSNLDFFKTIFINKYLTFFGKISYSFYLTHWPILIFIQYYYINPLTLIEPDVIDERPQIVEINVVFPAPFGPSKAIISLWFIFRFKFFTAIKLLSYFFTRF